MEFEIEAPRSMADVITVMHAAFAVYDLDPIPSSAMGETVESLNADSYAGWRMLVGYVRDQPVASVKMRLKVDKLYFGRLAILPSQQRNGLGRRMVAAVCDEARKHEALIVECKVRESEPERVEYYRSFGFEIISHEVTHSLNGAEIPTVTMHKFLRREQP